MMGATTAGAAARPDFRGIYLIVPMDAPVTRGLIGRALDNPNVDGVYLRQGWATIEPSHGSFDWSYLDQQIATVAARGKKVSIGIDAGQRAPAWLYAENAQPFRTVVQIPRQADFCAPISLPVPWDPTFLAEFEHMVAAMGARYANNPAVVMVKVTGIDYRTDETSLPSSRGKVAQGEAVADHRMCEYPDDVRNWQALGYSPGKVTAAFQRIVQGFATAFPRQALAMMTSQNALPPLGANGAPDPAAADLPETAFVAIGRSVAGDRFVAQVNNLRADQVDAGLMAHHGPTPIAFQAAWVVTGDDHCRMNGGHAPCDPDATFAQAIENVVNSRAQFVELFKEDIDNPRFAAVLARAHAWFHG